MFAAKTSLVILLVVFAHTAVHAMKSFMSEDGLPRSMNDQIFENFGMDDEIKGFLTQDDFLKTEKNHFKHNMAAINLPGSDDKIFRILSEEAKVDATLPNHNDFVTRLDIHNDQSSHNVGEQSINVSTSFSINSDNNFLSKDGVSNILTSIFSWDSERDDTEEALRQAGSHTMEIVQSAGRLASALGFGSQELLSKFSLEQTSLWKFINDFLEVKHSSIDAVKTLYSNLQRIFLAFVNFFELIRKTWIFKNHQPSQDVDGESPVLALNVEETTVEHDFGKISDAINSVFNILKMNKQKSY